MTQLHKHLENFVPYSNYIEEVVCPYERRVNQLAFPAIDKAITDFMHTVLPIKQYIATDHYTPIKHYPTEGGAVNRENVDKVVNELSLLRDKSTKLEQDLKISYHIPPTDRDTTALYGIDVRLEFYFLPPDTVKHVLTPTLDTYFNKMVVVHVDELEDYDFILG